MVIFDWPKGWRCVHTTATYALAQALLADSPLTRSMVVLNDGDCGDVWGETNHVGCRPHTTVWCHRFDVASVIEVLTRYTDSLVGTDPNVWSEHQTVYKHTPHDCVHIRTPGVPS